VASCLVQKEVEGSHLQVQGEARAREARGRKLSSLILSTLLDSFLFFADSLPSADNDSWKRISGKEDCWGLRSPPLSRCCDIQYKRDMKETRQMPARRGPRPTLNAQCINELYAAKAATISYRSSDCFMFFCMLCSKLEPSRKSC